MFDKLAKWRRRTSGPASFGSASHSPLGYSARQQQADHRKETQGGEADKETDDRPGAPLELRVRLALGKVPDESEQQLSEEFGHGDYQRDFFFGGGECEPKKASSNSTSSLEPT